MFSTSRLSTLLLVLVTVCVAACKSEPAPISFEDLKEEVKKTASEKVPRPVYLDPLDDTPACYLDLVGGGGVHINDEAVNPTGKYFLSIFGVTHLFLSGIKVWSLDSGKEVFSLSNIEGYQQFYFAKQDWLILITTSEIQLIDLNAPDPSPISFGKLDVIYASALSADGSRIAVSSRDGHLRVYSVETQKLLFDRPIDNDIRSEAFSFSATGNELLFYTFDGPFTFDGLMLANIEAGSTTRLQRKATSKDAVDVPLTNTILLTIAPCVERYGYGKQMILVNLQESSFSPLGSDDCTNMDYSPVSKLVAEVSGSSIRVWNVERQQDVKILETTRVPTMITFSSDGKQLFGFPADGPVQVWDALRGEKKPTSDDVNPARTMGIWTNKLVRIKRQWYRLNTHSGLRYSDCLYFEEPSSQSTVMQLCILKERQGFPWVIVGKSNRFDASEAGYDSVRPGFTDIKLFQRLLKRRYYQSGLLINGLTNGAVPNTPFLQRFSNNHLRGQHAAFGDILLNIGFFIGVIVLSFGAAKCFVSWGLHPALWQVTYYLPLHIRLMRLGMMSSIVPLIKDFTQITLRILLCFAILVFMDRVVALPLVTFFFGEVCLVQSFNERHVLFALPISQRHSLLSSILPYLNERANIAYVRMLAIPNSLLWTRLHTILVMTGLTLQKLCIFGVFVYAGIYLNNATLFAFGLGIGLWFYKHSNREAKSFLATSNATLIEQRTFRVFLETIGRAVETVIKVFSFLRRPREDERFKSLIVSGSFLLLRLVDSLLLGSLLFLFFYLSAVWLGFTLG